MDSGSIHVCKGDKGNNCGRRVPYFTQVKKTHPDTSLPFFTATSKEACVSNLDPEKAQDSVEKSDVLFGVEKDVILKEEGLASHVDVPIAGLEIEKGPLDKVGSKVPNLSKFKIGRKLSYCGYSGLATHDPPLCKFAFRPSEFAETASKVRRRVRRRSLAKRIRQSIERKAAKKAAKKASKKAAKKKSAKQLPGNVDDVGGNVGTNRRNPCVLLQRLHGDLVRDGKESPGKMHVERDPLLPGLTFLSWPRNI